MTISVRLQLRIRKDLLERKEMLIELKMQSLNDNSANNEEHFVFIQNLTQIHSILFSITCS